MSKRINALICLLLLFIGASSAVAQQNKRLTVQIQNGTILDCIKSIESQTNYSFLFSNAIGVDKKVSVNCVNQTLDHVLATVFTPNGISYDVTGNQVTLKIADQKGNLPKYGRTIHGSITDRNGTALAGVGVIQSGTTNGTVSGSDGSWSLNVPSTPVTLDISSLGYTTRMINVPESQSDFIIVLEEDFETLDDVIVIGYGTVKKSDLTGAVSQVKAKDLTSYAVTNPLQSLQGRVPGLNLVTNNGSPSAGEFSIRIRGVNSIKGGNSPLYIVDGMPSNPSSLSTHDIASIEVLKDASSTAIYGSRGANGIIIITTKKGFQGKTKVTYNGEYGVQSLRKKMDMMDATEYMKFINLQQSTDKGSVYFSDEEIASVGSGFDWQKAVFTNAPVQNHNLQVSGGNDNTRFSISGTALLRDGIIKTSGYDRYNLRSSVDHDINDKVNVQMIMGYTYVNRFSKATSGMGNRGGDLVNAAIMAPPTLTPFNEDGSYNDLRLNYPFISTSLVNPINEIDRSTARTEVNLFDLNSAITFKPFKGFSFKTSFGLENNDSRSDTYYNLKSLNGTNRGSVDSSRDVTVINENIANYTTMIAHDHAINVMTGFTYQQNVNKGLGASGSGFLSDVTETYALQSAANAGIPSSSYSKWVLMSYLARLNYSYKGKYLLTFSIRSDGSSRYSEGNKWGLFPSCAVAWHITEEPWFNLNSVNDLKIRASYGITGSTAISPYSTLNMLSSGNTPMDGKLVTYFTPTDIYPGNLRWESTRQYNVGLDLAMLNNRLRLTADAYYKMTYDLLNSVNLPRSSGYSSTTQNIGKMSNRGLEFLIEGDIIRNQDWYFNISANAALNRNRIGSLSGGHDIYGSSLDFACISGTVNLLREGEPMGVFYVYKSDGFTDDGRFKYKDINEDGLINNEDRMILGNPHPIFTGGINSELAYKNLSISMFWSGSYGNDLYNLQQAQYYDYGLGLNMPREVYYNHWDPNKSAEENAKAKYPKISEGSNVLQSDILIEDGSYLRLKNIQLSYKLPIKKRWISSASIYISAQNYVTLTRYSGLDPEVNAYSSDITVGIDWHTYPMSKTISFGTNISF